MNYRYNKIQLMMYDLSQLAGISRGVAFTWAARERNATRIATQAGN